jgi:hypothetical protein
MDLKKIIIGFIGKKVKKALRDGKTEEQWEVSKAKITAVVTVLITAVQVLGPAFGYPVEIPNEVYQLLAAIGVWASEWVRCSRKAAKAWRFARF